MSVSERQFQATLALFTIVVLYLLVFAFDSDRPIQLTSLLITALGGIALVSGLRGSFQTGLFVMGGGLMLAINDAEGPWIVLEILAWPLIILGVVNFILAERSPEGE